MYPRETKGEQVTRYGLAFSVGVRIKRSWMSNGMWPSLLSLRRDFIGLNGGPGSGQGPDVETAPGGIIRTGVSFSLTHSAYCQMARTCCRLDVSSQIYWNGRI